jgi:hypothetical protein
MEHPVIFALPEQHLEHDIVAILGRVDLAFQPLKPDLDIAFGSHRGGSRAWSGARRVRGLSVSLRAARAICPPPAVYLRLPRSMRAAASSMAPQVSNNLVQTLLDAV